MVLGAGLTAIITAVLRAMGRYAMARYMSITLPVVLIFMLIRRVRVQAIPAGALNS
jgi:hypothetical protein